MANFFPFGTLSTELALEIVRLAATTEFTDPSQNYYRTAAALSAVSYNLRLATMPYLLDTVICASAEQVLAFCGSLVLQREHRKKSSRLAIDYKQHIRRFWSTECWESVVDESPNALLNYGAIYDVMRSVDSLGLNFRSLHLLYNGLASEGAHPQKDWSCRKVTFAGDFWRWRPLTSSPEGLSFLACITHLVLWIPCNESTPEETILPPWVENVPFETMPSLTHFTFPLLRNRRAIPDMYEMYAPTEMLVMNAASASLGGNAEVFKRWLRSENPLLHGVVVPVNVLPMQSNVRPDVLAWELSFSQGESDKVWERAEERADVSRI